jgi:hypothetical protein
VLPALVLTAMFAGAGRAEASVLTFKAETSERGIATFRIEGVAADAIVGAQLVARAGKKKNLPVEQVRAEAAEPPHVVEVRSKRRPRALKVRTAPDTTITEGPEDGSETASSSTKFSFSSTISGKTRFYCSIDGGTPSECSPGVTLDNLAEGLHSFSVYSEDRRGSVDPTPATRSWKVVSASSVTPDPGDSNGGGGSSDPAPAPTSDTTPPETSIQSGPADGSVTTSNAVSFSFDGSDDVGVAGYECKLDNAAWSTCSSPKSYGGLAAAEHSFSVRARDSAGNVDPTPATRTWKVSAPTNSVDVPSSVSSNCSTDVTSQLLSWIASVPNGSTLRFASGGCYRVEGTLELKNRDLTIDGNGSTFRSQNAVTGQRSIWRAIDSKITFRDMNIVGSYANGGTLTDNLQWAHAIDLRGTDVVIADVSMSDVAGDCIYFGLGADRSTGEVRDSSCRRIGRNGVSVVAGDSIRVERMTTDRIGYIAFDVEPNTGSGFGSTDVVFDSNTIGSYAMKAYTIIGNAPVRDQQFTNNRVVGQSLEIGVVGRSHRPQNLKISGNSSDTPADPAAMNLDGVDGLIVKGNTVPLSGGTMAQVDSSCNVQVSSNLFPGGSTEASITNATC